MISRIRGTLLRRDVSMVEVLTAGGVAYQIEIPITVFERLPREGTEIELRTHQVVREDAVTLYGFVDDIERSLFTKLMTVGGVGPRVALGLLSKLRADGVVRAIGARDVRALSQAPGVGRKLAERISLELADKVGELAIVAGADARATHGRAAEEAIGALVALGYSQQQAAGAVRQALDEKGQLEGSELIKAALAAVVS